MNTRSIPRTNKKRDLPVVFRVTRAEHSRFARSAARAGASLSTWIRMTLLARTRQEKRD